MCVAPELFLFKRPSFKINMVVLMLFNSEELDKTSYTILSHDILWEFMNE
jgi:hypothetical protein